MAAVEADRLRRQINRVWPVAQYGAPLDLARPDAGPADHQESRIVLDFYVDLEVVGQAGGDRLSRVRQGPVEKLRQDILQSAGWAGRFSHGQRFKLCLAHRLTILPNFIGFPQPGE
jgi:hypothetical protein